MAAGYTKMSISKQLSAICTQHNITVVDSLTQQYKHYVELAEEDITLIALCWDSKNSWHKFTVHTGQVQELRNNS